ncbi:MAG: alpha/beta hydrolase [Thermoanaerobaculia bacterium]|nr:alpha/beta hydrolase [Thermoanaerobaculia bacterium]
MSIPPPPFLRSWPGDDAGRPPVLFVHGLGDSGLGFEELAGSPRLAAWPRWAPDLAGYGRRRRSGSPASLSDHADQLAAWLEGSGAPPCAVVGHSMGGVVALLLAERHPGRVAALVDVEGNKSQGDCGFSGRTLGWTVESFAARGFAEICEQVRRGAASDPSLATYHASLRLADPRTFFANARELVELSRAERLAERLAALSCPTVYVGGADRPGGVCERSLELLVAAGVEPVLLSPAGHWVFLDQPERFLDVLIDALPR